MSFRTLLNRLFTRPNSNRYRKALRPATRRLALESLEDRLTPAAVMSVWNAAILEGNTGAQNVAVTVTLSEPHSNAVSVNFRTVDGTAIAGSDYDAVSGTLTFTKNVMSKTILVPVRGDIALEPDEYFYVRLDSAKAGAKIANGQAIVSIMNNEPSVSISDASLVEGDAGTTLMQFAVSITNAYDLPVTVNYATRDGSATAPSDFLETTGTLTFGPNDSSPQMITIEVVGDEVPELDKSFFVDVTTPDSYAKISRGTAVGTIWDNEPRIVISDAYNYGESTITFTVSVSNLEPDDDAVTVDFTTVDGTATAANGDYVHQVGTLIFDSANATQTITVEVNNLTFLYDTYFSILLTNASPNALLANESATGYSQNGYYDYYYYDYGYYDYGYYDYYGYYYY
ncbi:MAG: hypothetical protein L0Y72_26735 [Gemmataceae bacterium]|nr:hypothetical protein [Gemmataceae bacterium]